MNIQPAFQFRPHPLAPYFSNGPADAGLIVSQLEQEILSDHMDTANQMLWDLLRQVSFTNLWFFLKYVAGFSGPYNLINDQLQLDMCNFRQSDSCMASGARWASFIPRGGMKSTVFTHGGSSWEMLRWPDIRILIINAVEDRAYDFTMNILRTFRNNDMLAWLFPEYVIPKSSARVILPNRTKFYTEDNVEYKGYGGELAGIHVNLLLYDDAIGVEDLDSQMMASVSMDRAKKKYHTSSRALLVEIPVDRVADIGTLYCINDLHYIPIKDCKEVVGYKDGFIKPVEGGRYTIYYRKAIEDGVSIDESHYTVEDMERLRLDDPWSYHSQYQNDPTEGSSLELNKHPIQRAILKQEDNDGYVLYYSDEDKQIRTPLSKMYVTVGVDFAATATGINHRSSRSAIEMCAEDGQGRSFLIQEHCGFFPPRQTIDLLFDLHEKFEGYIHQTILESNALQKFFIPIIQDMAFDRDLYFPATPKSENLPKEVRIRAGVGSVLAKGKFYIVEGQGKEFLDERDLFPQDAYKRDALDAASKALSALIKPLSEEEEALAEEEEEEQKQRQVGKAGY